MDGTSPRRVTARSEPWMLHDVAASRAAETHALGGSEAHALMQRAGTSVAKLALAIGPHARHVRVMAGPGNNGGDGLVAARWLWRAGRSVDVVLWADPARLAGDAQWALEQARASGVHIHDRPDARPVDLYLDALLGLGTSRPVEGSLAEAIMLMNRAAAPLLAVDLPSGLDSDTGNASAAAVRATHTLALLSLKPGLFTAMGRDLAGQVWFDDLGLPPEDATACARLTGLAEIGRGERPHASHKGRFGDVAVVGGSPGMSGAAWLAARAALAAGAGRVYASLLDEAAPLLLPARPELMGSARVWLEPPERLQDLTIVCGCGGGTSVAAALPPLLAHAARLVLDADALNAIAGDAALQQQLMRRSMRGRCSVLTPHPLEAARLLGTSSAEVQADRLGAARTLAERFSAVVVLKGSGTVIAAPQCLPAINPSGNAALASAGTGDVLAGWIAGHWSAEGGPAGDIRCAVNAALTSVWRHGRAADRHVERGRQGPLTASDLIDAMGDTSSDGLRDEG